MKNVFIICNHTGLFLGKQGQWLDESEPAQVYRTPHRDVALNHLIEVNARDIEQRLVLMQCPINEKDIPMLGDAIVARKSVPVTFDDAENGDIAVVSDTEPDAEDEELAANDHAATADIGYPA